MDRHKLKISKVFIHSGRVPSVRVIQRIVTNRKKKAAKGLNYDLLYPDVDVDDLTRPSMRYRAGLRGLEEMAQMNVSPTRSFENTLDQFDRKCDVMLDQKRRLVLMPASLPAARGNWTFLRRNLLRQRSAGVLSWKSKQKLRGRAQCR